MTFIVFEGGEGVGKTTQLEKLHNLLKRHNFAVVKTREPGGTPYAEKIRNLFKEKTESPPLPLTEIYLLCASRHEHIQKVILPALKEKKIVLCDRFLDSTYVYQCVVGGIEKKLVDKISAPVIKKLVPDLTFVFYCDVHTSQARIAKEYSRNLDRYDSASLKLKSGILEGYKVVYDEQYSYPSGKTPKRVFIDATLGIEETFKIILDFIKEFCHLDKLQDEN